MKGHIALLFIKRCIALLFLAVLFSFAVLAQESTAPETARVTSGSTQMENYEYLTVGCRSDAECSDLVCPQVVGQDTPRCMPVKNEVSGNIITQYRECQCGPNRTTIVDRTAAKCGDGVCTPGVENQPACFEQLFEDGQTHQFCGIAMWCPIDCKETPQKPEGATQLCGDGVCEGVENEKFGKGESEGGVWTLACPRDCDPEYLKCGNGKCQGDIGETLKTCPEDCTQTSCLYLPPAERVRESEKIPLTDKTITLVSIKSDDSVATFTIDGTEAEINVGEEKIISDVRIQLIEAHADSEKPSACFKAYPLTATMSVSAHVADQYGLHPNDIQGLQIKEGEVQYVITPGTADNYKIPVAEATCQGCLHEEKCISFGFRVDRKYCDLDGGLKGQKSEGSCSNNFECRSNLCIGDECVEVGLWQTFITWLKSFFG